MNKTVEYLTISYPNFALGQVIDPDEANQNNREIVDKSNDIIDELHYVMDTLMSLDGASEIGGAVTGLIGGNVQELLNSMKAFIDAHKSDTTNPHNVTPAQLGVYTKFEIDPYLRGGDTLIRYDVFTIVNSNNGNGTFTYKGSDNVNRTGTISSEGYQVFALEAGTYNVGENRISATINDTLQRSLASGGLVEIDTTHVALTSPEGNGAEITFMYFERIGILGNGTVQMGTIKPTSGAFWYKVVG